MVSATARASSIWVKGLPIRGSCGVVAGRELGKAAGDEDRQVRVGLARLRRRSCGAVHLRHGVVGDHEVDRVGGQDLQSASAPEPAG